MKKKILLLENDVLVSFPAKSILETKNYEVIDVEYVPEANYVMKKYIFDCIITDLSLSVEGFTKEEESESRNGLYAGWIWVRNYLINNNIINRNKIIIYSGFIKQWLNIFNEELSEIDYLDKGKCKPIDFIQQVERVANRI